MENSLELLGRVDKLAWIHGVFAQDDLQITWIGDGEDDGKCG